MKSLTRVCVVSAAIVGLGIVAAMTVIEFTGWKVVTVRDVAAFEEFRLMSDRDFVSGVSIRVEGELDGAAELAWPDGHTERIALHGSVKRAAYRDHFLPGVRLTYAPGGARHGRLRIAYKFH